MFAERGPETVIPGVPGAAGAAGAAGGSSRPIVNFHYYGPQNPSPEQQQALMMHASAMIGVS